jgi:putative oxidoreductase
MDWILLLGRVLFVSVFVVSAVFVHLVGRKQGIEYARAYNAPFPELSVPGWGVLMVAAGALIVLGVWVDLAALVLVAAALSFAWYMHPFWKETDPQTRLSQQVNFQKNVGLAGGGLILFFLFQQFGEAIDLVVGPAALFD